MSFYYYDRSSMNFNKYDFLQLSMNDISGKWSVMISIEESKKYESWSWLYVNIAVRLHCALCMQLIQPTNRTKILTKVHIPVNFTTAKVKQSQSYPSITPTQFHFVIFDISSVFSFNIFCKRIFIFTVVKHKTSHKSWRANKLKHFQNQNKV